MPKSPFSGDNSPIQPIPTTMVNLDQAQLAWAEYVAITEEWVDLSRKRDDAHARFLSAFEALDQ